MTIITPSETANARLTGNSEYPAGECLDIGIRVLEIRVLNYRMQPISTGTEELDHVESHIACLGKPRTREWVPVLWNNLGRRVPLVPKAELLMTKLPRTFPS